MSISSSLPEEASRRKMLNNLVHEQQPLRATFVGEKADGPEKQSVVITVNPEIVVFPNSNQSRPSKRKREDGNCD